jgi:hypothetical protein
MGDLEVPLHHVPAALSACQVMLNHPVQAPAAGTAATAAAAAAAAATGAQQPLSLACVVPR